MQLDESEIKLHVWRLSAQHVIYPARCRAACMLSASQRPCSSVANDKLYSPWTVGNVEIIHVLVAVTNTSVTHSCDTLSHTHTWHAWPRINNPTSVIWRVDATPWCPGMNSLGRKMNHFCFELTVFGGVVDSPPLQTLCCYFVILIVNLIADHSNILLLYFIILFFSLYIHVLVFICFACVIQIQIQIGICRAPLTDCPGALTKCQNARSLRWDF